MTNKEYKDMCAILDKYLTVIHDRPQGSLPRWVLTTFGLSKAKSEIKEKLVKEDK